MGDEIPLPCVRLKESRAGCIQFTLDNRTGREAGVSEQAIGKASHRSQLSHSSMLFTTSHGITKEQAPCDYGNLFPWLQGDKGLPWDGIFLNQLNKQDRCYASSIDLQPGFARLPKPPEGRVNSTTP